MKLKIIVLCFLVLITVSCRGNERNERMKLKINNVILDVEIADTQEKRKQGLMFREKLDKESGMIFIFDKEEKVAFWMKNTGIPLSVAYISKSGHIREIHDLQPFSLHSIQSDYSVLYALEVNQGFFKKNRIEVGDQIVFP